MLAQARSLAEQYMREPSTVDASLATTVVKLAALNGDVELYDQFLAQTQVVKTPEEHDRYLYGLARFSDPALLRQTLEYALSPEVRPGETPYLIATVLQNPAGRHLAWEFVKSRWTEVRKKIPQQFGSRAIIYWAGSACDAQTRDDIEEFFTENRVEEAQRTLRQAIERINSCINLRLLQKSNLEAWLRKKGLSVNR